MAYSKDRGDAPMRRRGGRRRKKRDSADLSGDRTGNTGDRPDTGRKEYGQCICRKN